MLEALPNRFRATAGRSLMPRSGDSAEPKCFFIVNPPCLVARSRAGNFIFIPGDAGKEKKIFDTQK